MKRPQVAMVGVIALLSVAYALVASWTPVQGDDWNHWVWAGQHRDDGTAQWLVSFMSSHFTYSDAIGYVVSRSRWFHVLVSPAVMVALVFGLFTVAMRRLPRASWDDLLGITLTWTLIWLAQPSAAVTMFHTPNVAMFIYGAAAAVWFVAPFRCGWNVPRLLWPVIALAGYCAGTSSRAIATATLVGTILGLRAMPRERRVRWMWIALGGLVIGVIAGYAKPPWIEFARVFRRGFEQNLVGPGLLKYAIEELGEVVSLVAAFVLVDLCLGALGRGRADLTARPDPADTLYWFLGWFLTSIWCLFGPRYNEAMLFPASCMIVIAALPYFAWLATSRLLRYAIITITVGVHAIAWPIALVKYHRFGAEGIDRIAQLEGSKPGSIALVPHYSETAPTAWWKGEDLGLARARQLLAIESFGLRDIVLVPPFRRGELNPDVNVKLEVDDVTDAELNAARVPTIWATELSAARKQFETFIKRLRRVKGKPVSARLVVTNIEFSERENRPLLAAWADGPDLVSPRIARSPLDENSKYTVRIYGRDIRRFKEAWLVEGGTASSTPYRSGSPQVQALTITPHITVVCSAERCLAADAFLPRF